MACEKYFIVLVFMCSTYLAYCNAIDFVIAETEIFEVDSYGCKCAGYSCGCCAHMEAPKIRLNDTGCVNLTYLAKEYGISFTMTIDNLTIYNETISARNPPPICFGAPILEEYVDLCIHFYDLDATKTKLHGCVDIEARLHHIVIGRYQVGCFNIGNSSIGRWKQYHQYLVEKIRSEETLASKFFKEVASVSAEIRDAVSNLWNKL